MSKNNIYGPDLYKRNQHGLLENASYVFNEDGSVDWRSMIKDEYLYPNKDWFEYRKKPVPESIEGLKDNQLLIMLGGIKSLAKLRGFKSVKFNTENVSNGYVKASCTIEWLSNYESNNTSITYEDSANATLDNTSSFASKFLETIACNRAFVRCVRNFLNVHIVGADEIDKSKGANNAKSFEYDSAESTNVALTPSAMLEKAAREKTGSDSFDNFKTVLRDFWKQEQYRNEEIKNWDSFSDIPAKECRKLLVLVKKL
jgi:hypothetical protein